MTPKQDCQLLNIKHDWEDDEMFGCGAVVMLTNDNPENKLS